MVDKLPIISGVHFEKNPERLKIVLPLKHKWPYLLIYTALAIMWLVMMVGGVIFGIRIAFSGERYAFLFTIMTLIFLYVLYRFGRFLMRQWAHYLATREILFVNLEELILRRPISIWGNTDVYGIEHINAIYANPPTKSLAFDYGYRHIYFADGLTEAARLELMRFLNEQYFPDHVPDE